MAAQGRLPLVFSSAFLINVSSIERTAFFIAQCDQAPAVFPLAVAVVEPPFGTALAPPMGGSPLHSPGFDPTALRAVLLAAVAGPAHVEDRPVRLGSAEALSERDLLAGPHRPCRARHPTASWEA